jgi:uncharacterized membrane protein
MTVSVSRDEFLKQVAANQKTVYSEDSQNNASNILLPLAVEGLAVLTGIALVWLFSVLWGIYSFVVFLLLLIGPMVAGTVLLLVYLRRKVKDRMVYGMRGISRTLLSRAIFFLDMIDNGQLEIGKLKGSSVPEEAAATTTLAFGAAVYVLKKIDKDLAKTWTRTLREKLSPEISWRAVWLVRITLFGTLLMVPLIVIVNTLLVLEVLSAAIAFPVMIAAFVVMVVFVVVLYVYAVKSSHSEVPEGARAAIAEPQIRFDTERALEKLLETYNEEARHPLRVLVLGDNNAFVYTDMVYETSRGYTLRAAALFPNQTTSDLTDDQWTD